MLFGAFLGVTGIDGLWDEIRTQVLCHACGTYSLPFGYSVSWWWAGDLSILVTLVGILVFMLTFIDMSRPLGSGEQSRIHGLQAITLNGNQSRDESHLFLIGVGAEVAKLGNDGKPQS